MADGSGQNNIKRPIPRITFALNYYITGLNTLSYHITNIAIHIITAFFAYLVFLKTLMILKAREEISFSAITCQDIALLGAVLWAIHPLQTQAVTYIVQRMASMAAMFYIIAMFFYIQGRLKKGEFKTVLFFGASFVCWVLAILSKENAVMLPLSIIIYEMIFFGITRKKTFYILSLLILFIVASICILIFTRGYNVESMYQMHSAFENKTIKFYAYRPFTMAERLLTEPRILVWYLFLVVCPISDFLTLESDIVVSSAIFRPMSSFTSILFISIIIAFSVYKYNKYKIFSFAILFFFVNHMVESTFVGLELYFEHRNYLPSIFIYMAISYGLIYMYMFFCGGRKIFTQSIIVIFVIGILISQGNATYLRNDIWNNEITLMEDSIKKSPNNIRPYVTISSLYMKLRMFDKAKHYLKEGEKLYNKNPSLYQVNFPGLLYYNAGILYTYDWEKKDIDKAISLMFKSCEIYPGDYLPHMTLGVLLFRKGEYELAEQAMVNASMLNNDFSPIHYGNLGRVLFSNGKIDESINAFLSGLHIEPSIELRLNLVAAYLKKGDLSKARYVLGEIPTYNNSLAYLLNYALLYPGPKGDAALEKLAGLFVDNNINYCEWIDKINNNNMLGIIYPDINPIEKQLREKYLNYLKNYYNKNNEKFMKARSCDT